jgi:hypothetical protein
MKHIVLIDTLGMVLTLNSELNAKTSLIDLTTSVTLPQPLIVGTEFTLIHFPQFRPYIEGGYFRYNFGSDRERSFKTLSINLGLKYFPWQSGFYTNASLGYRRLGFEADITNLQVDGEPLAKKADTNLDAAILGLSTGYRFDVSPSLSLGFDVGIQISLIHGGSLKFKDVQNEATSDLQVDDESFTSRISGLVIPQISIIRLNWKL